ncbi:hypothetical protein JL722_14979 [Aureococcus anophagefferens]|nr:hypothetical protein JL722_14979 [Aureococcus anophagefferens]
MAAMEGKRRVSIHDPFDGNEDNNPYKVKGRACAHTQGDKFTELCNQDPRARRVRRGPPPSANARPARRVDQCEYFLKSFIFALGDSWKDVPQMCSDYQKREGHGPAMILKEYYERHEAAPEEDLGNDCVGVCGVGKSSSRLFTMPKGLSPQLEAALEAFADEKKKREAKIKELTAKAEKGGVKGMAAKQELVILESGDKTEMNRIELTLNAAKRKANKQSGEDALKKEKEKQAAELKKAAEAKKAKMKARMAMFEKKDERPRTPRAPNRRVRPRAPGPRRTTGGGAPPRRTPGAAGPAPSTSW